MRKLKQIGGEQQMQQEMQQDPQQQEQQQMLVEMIQQYAEANNMDPEELMRQIQEAEPEEQQAMLEQIMQEMQGGLAQAQGQMQQQPMPEQNPYAQMGGEQDQEQMLLEMIYQYAELKGIDPEQLMQQLQAASEEEQQQMVAQIMQEMQQMQGGQGQEQMQGQIAQQDPAMDPQGQEQMQEDPMQYQQEGGPNNSMEDEQSHSYMDKTSNFVRWIQNKAMESNQMEEQGMMRYGGLLKAEDGVALTPEQIKQNQIYKDYWDKTHESDTDRNQRYWNETHGDGNYMTQNPDNYRYRGYGQPNFNYGYNPMGNPFMGLIGLGAGLIGGIGSLFRGRGNQGQNQGQGWRQGWGQGRFDPKRDVDSDPNKRQRFSRNIPTDPLYKPYKSPALMKADNEDDQQFYDREKGVLDAEAEGDRVRWENEFWDKQDFSRGNQRRTDRFERRQDVPHFTDEAGYNRFMEDNRYNRINRKNFQEYFDKGNRLDKDKRPRYQEGGSFEDWYDSGPIDMYGNTNKRRFGGNLPKAQYGDTDPFGDDNEIDLVNPSYFDLLYNKHDYGTDVVPDQDVTYMKPDNPAVIQSPVTPKLSPDKKKGTGYDEYYTQYGNPYAAPEIISGIDEVASWKNKMDQSVIDRENKRRLSDVTRTHGVSDMMNRGDWYSGPGLAQGMLRPDKQKSGVGPSAFAKRGGTWFNGGFYRNGGSRYYQDGGGYNEGDEVYLSDSEIQELLNSGATLDFLD